MRARVWIGVLMILVSGCICLGAQKDDKKSDAGGSVVGTWSGTWAGGSTGTFEMTIKNQDGKLIGTLTANPSEGSGYTASFTSVQLTGNKFMAKMDDPSGEVEITIEGTLTSPTMKGEYSVRPKAQTDKVESGSWEAKKKA